MAQNYEAVYVGQKQMIEPNRHKRPELTGAVTDSRGIHQNQNSRKNTILATTSNEILAVSIDENGFEVDNQGFHFANISPATLDNTYSFQLNGRSFLCIGSFLYQYDTNKKMWSKHSNEMNQIRVGAACVSIGQNVIITGGCLKSGHQPQDLNEICTDSVDILKPDFTIHNIGKLPIAVKFHTLTKISENEFILCGGLINQRSMPTDDVYFGRLFDDGCSQWIKWAKLKPLNKPRAKHCSLYIGNRLVVIGGEPNWSKVGDVMEYLKLKRSSKSLRSVAFTKNCHQEMYLPFITSRKGWKQAKDLPFFMNRASAVVSPDDKYAVIVSGGDRGQGNKVVVMDAKTLRIQLLERGDDMARKVSVGNILDLNDGWNIYDSRLWDNADGEEGEDSGEDRLPCLNCSLIEQGSAISLSDNRCSLCGEDVGKLLRRE